MSSWNATIEEQSKNSFYSLSLYMMLCYARGLWFSYIDIYFTVRVNDVLCSMISGEQTHRMTWWNEIVIICCVSAYQKKGMKKNTKTLKHTQIHIIQGRLVVSCIKYMSLSLSRTHKNSFLWLP